MSIENRYDFVMIFDVENGNPNGDPDAGNAPRIDSETGIGYITDVCLKRKIRNYVELVKDGAPSYAILIKPDKALNTKFSEAYDALNLKKRSKVNEEIDVNEEYVEKEKKSKKEDNYYDIIKARDYMCKNFFDVRVFGAVMSTGDYSCGVVRGPVQINFATSVDPISIQDVAITRQARTTEERAETGETEIGRKSIVPYALYRAEGYVSAALANKITDLSEDDLTLLWESIVNMFENDHSAARGKMVMRKLFVFKHNSVLGNAPSSILFDKITITNKNPSTPARRFSDYEIKVDASMPDGVILECKL